MNIVKWVHMIVACSDFMLCINYMEMEMKIKNKTDLNFLFLFKKFNINWMDIIVA